MAREDYVKALMTPVRRDPIQKRLDFLVPLILRLILLLTLSLLFFLPLAKGGGTPWALPAALGLQLLAYSLWGLGRWVKRENDPLRWHWSLGIPLFLSFLAFIYLLPLGPLVRFLSPAAAAAWQQFNAYGLGPTSACLSLNPSEGIYYGQFFLLCFLLAFLLYNRCQQADHLVLVALTIIASATLNAALAFYPFFTSSALFSENHLPVEILHGTFPNRNHFALFMGIGAQLSLGLLLAFFPIKVEYLRKPDLTERLICPIKGMFLFTLLLLVTAQIFSLSRGGALSTIPVLTSFFILWLFFRHVHITAKRDILAVIAIFISSIFLALTEAIPRLSDRYKALTAGVDLTSNDRLLVWKESLNLLKDYWLTGAGIGTYTDAISRYESGLFPFALTYAAHNDWLEFCCETGLPLALVLFSAFFYLLYTRTHRLRFQKDDKLRDLGYSCLAAIIGVSIHELFDYNLRALANAVTFTAVCTLLLLCSKISSAATPRRPLRWQRYASLILAGTCLFFALIKFSDAYGAIQQEKISRHLQPQDKGYSLSNKDYEHLAGVAHKALRFSLTPNPDLLRQHAIAQVNSISPSNDHIQGEALYAQALKDMRTACRLRPLNGDFHLTHAQIAEQAALFKGQIDEAQLLRYYQMAAYAYCHQTTILNACADAYLRSWLRMSASPLANRETLPIARNLTLQTYAEFIRISPAGAPRALHAIWQLAPDPHALLTLVPENLLAYEALFSFLLDKHYYDEAAKALNTWEKLNLERPDNENLNGLSWAEKQKQDTRNRDELQYEIVRQKLLLLGLTQQWQSRAELLLQVPDILELAQQKQRKNIQKMINKGDFTLAGERLTRLVHQAPSSGETRLLEANLKNLLGKGDDMVAILTHFSYTPHPPSIAILQQALALLDKHTSLLPTKFFPRHRFLGVALRLRLAEQKALSPGDAQLQEWLQELQALHEWNNTHTAHAWIQRQLVPFYIGRLHELAGRLPQAADAYEESLTICPNNLYVLQRLAQIPGTRGAEARRNLQEWSTYIPAQCRLDSAITLFALKATPAQISRSDEAMTIEYLWLCESDPLEDGLIAISFKTADTIIFNDSISFIRSENPMVSWRVGELQRTVRTFPPLLEAVKSGMPFRSQSVTAHVSMIGFNDKKVLRQPLPPAAFPLFSFAIADHD